MQLHLHLRIKEMIEYTVTFAVYDEEPIACEGDDRNADIQRFTVKCKHGEIEDLANTLLLRLSNQSSSYFQIWDIRV